MNKKQMQSTSPTAINPRTGNGRGAQAHQRVETKVNTIDRKLAALAMKKAGSGYWDIAVALGYASASGAHAAVVSALNEVLREPAEEVRSMEVQRLDHILDKLWSSIGSDPQGLHAVDRVLKIMERRAKLLGLDAPVKVAPTDPTGDFVYDGSAIIGRLLPELTLGSETATTDPVVADGTE